ncbi:hypothetical protein GOB57_24300 [Sinorhizobium meliloti]|nr:hypothetical protein [Sinorhizobium meliloti]
MTPLPADPIEILLRRVERSARSIRMLLIAGEIFGVGPYAFEGYKLMSEGGKRISEEFPVRAPGVASRLARIFDREAAILKPHRDVSLSSMVAILAIGFCCFLVSCATAWTDLETSYRIFGANHPIITTIFVVTLFKAAFTFLNLPHAAIAI